MTKVLVKKLPKPHSTPDIKVNKTIQPVKKGDPANIEAQRGETVIGNWQKDGIPEMYMIGGKPHSEGGTDLNAPDNSFIFSKEKSLRITNPDILKMFGKKEKVVGYDPAEISKQYDINNYRKILAEPNSDRMQRETAELMIKNYNGKLGALALAQESKKGFPDGIPFVSIPYLESMGIDPASLVHSNGADEAEVPTDNEENIPTKKTGGPIKIKIVKRPQFQEGGSSTSNVSKSGDNPIPPVEGGWMSKYNQLEQTYIANPKIQTAVYEQYKKDHPTTKLSEAQVNNYLITLQRHNYKLQNKFNDTPDELNTKDWDKGTASDRYKKEIKSIGENPLTPEQVKIAQGAYRGLVRLQDDPEHADFFSQYGLKEFGPKKGAHQLNGRNVSSEDGLVGSDTVNQLLYPKDPVQQNIPAPEVNTQTALLDLKKPELKPTVKEKSTPFWTQDLIKMAGAAGDYARLKKYMPWQAGYQTVLPQAVYYDPTRELAANSEQANIAEQNLGAFAGVQALSSRMSDVQGSALKNAADIIGRYNNLNVGVANTTEMNRVNIMNQDSQRRSDRTTALYDKNVIANQQFDNAKAQARQNMRQSFIDAWTNRGKTQALNSMNKQYNVDPRTGNVNFTGVPGNVVPTNPNQDVLSYYNKLMEDPNLRAHPEHATELLKLYQKEHGLPGDTAIPYSAYAQQ